MKELNYSVLKIEMLSHKLIKQEEIRVIQLIILGLQYQIMRLMLISGIREEGVHQSDRRRLWGRLHQVVLLGMSEVNKRWKRMTRWPRSVNRCG